MAVVKLLCMIVLTVGTFSLDTQGMDVDAGNNVVDFKILGLPDPIMKEEDLQTLQMISESLLSANIDRDSFVSRITQAALTADSSDTCLTDVFFLVSMISSNKTADLPFKTVATQYADAISKIPHGILEGKWLWEGSYQQCKKISQITNPQSGTSFKGTYMSSALYSNGKPVLNNVYPIVIGYCVPDSCNEAAAGTVLSIALGTLEKDLHFEKLNLAVVQTISSTMPSLNSGAKATLAVIGIILYLMMLGTLLDYVFTTIEKPKVVMNGDTGTYSEQTEHTGLLAHENFNKNIQHDGKCQNVLGIIVTFFKAFSVRSNAVKLFGTKTADGPLACLNGIRVMSMWWVILGHTYAFVPYVSENYASAIDFIKRFTFQPILNGTFSVDSFFFLSGLLVTYLSIKEIQEKGKLNWVYFFVHRYWRLTPLLAFLILFYTNMFPYIMFGPNRFLIQTFDPMTKACQDDWWSNLLYINNFYPNYGSLSKTCVAWTWYLANDMQFYIFISPPVILALTRKKKLGLISIAFLILSCVVIRGFLVIYYGLYGLQGGPTKHVDDPWAVNGALYVRPYTRYSVYVVGMLTGYVLAVKKNRIHMHRVVACLGWAVAIATGIAVIYGQYYYNHRADERPAPHMTLAASTFYVSLSRTAWGFCLAWVVLACVAGKGGVVRDILSWKVWAPLGRLTYAAYIVHPVAIYFFYFNQERPLHLSDLSMIYIFIGNLVVAYGVAFVVSMAVEAPMIQLERLVIKILKSFQSRRSQPSYNNL